MSWTQADLNDVAAYHASVMNPAEQLALAWAIVQRLKAPQDHAALTLFRDMVSEHCADLRLNAAIHADLSAYDEIERDMPAHLVPQRLLAGNAKTQATTTHEQPEPEPGPSAERVALAIVRDAVARSDDSWFFQILGAVSLFALMAIGLFAGEIFK